MRDVKTSYAAMFSNGVRFSSSSRNLAPIVFGATGSAAIAGTAAASEGVAATRPAAVILADWRNSRRPVLSDIGVLLQPETLRQADSSCTSNLPWTATRNALFPPQQAPRV